MNRNRNLVLGLGLALMAVLSCTAGELTVEPPAGGGSVPLESPVDTAGVPVDSGTTAPIDTLVDPATPPMDTTGTEPIDTTIAAPPGSISEVDLLACEPQRYAADMRVIGPAGGELRVGNHKLTILPSALSKEVPIVMEQVEGTVNSVRLSPEGLRFAYPAVLSLSYKNCPTATWHYKRIVYTDESLSILEILPSLDFNRASQVKGLIRHFSRYAVAY